MGDVSERADVPAIVDGYERYVLTVDGQVPSGTPEQKNAPATFCRAGTVVSVHKGHVPGSTWRVYDPKNPYGPGLDLPTGARKPKAEG